MLLGGLLLPVLLPMPKLNATAKRLNRRSNLKTLVCSGRLRGNLDPRRRRNDLSKSEWNCPRSLYLHSSWNLLARQQGMGTRQLRELLLHVCHVRLAAVHRESIRLDETVDRIRYRADLFLAH